MDAQQVGSGLRMLAASVTTLGYTSMTEVLICCCAARARAPLVCTLSRRDVWNTSTLRTGKKERDQQRSTYPVVGELLLLHACSPYHHALLVPSTYRSASSSSCCTLRTGRLDKHSKHVKSRKLGTRLGNSRFKELTLSRSYLLSCLSRRAHDSISLNPTEFCESTLWLHYLRGVDAGCTPRDLNCILVNSGVGKRLDRENGCAVSRSARRGTQWRRQGNTDDRRLAGLLEEGVVSKRYLNYRESITRHQ